MLGTILLLPLFCTLVLELRQNYLFERVRERLKEETLETIMIPASDLTWLKEGREVLVNDRYFDVENWHLENGICYLTGAFDEEETTIAHILGMQSPEQSPFLELLLIGQCFVALLFFSSLFNPFIFFRRCYARREEHYLFLFQSLILAPPRF